MSSSDNDSNTSSQKLLRGIICLGMYYNGNKDIKSILRNSDSTKAKSHKLFLDWIRYNQLLKMGYHTVISLNDGKFTESKVGKHIRANFNFSSSIKKEIDALYPLGLVVSAIVLDFCYSPVFYY
jgi:hypothetical protein